MATRPATDEMFTIEPPPALIMPGSTVCIRETHRLIDRADAQEFGFVSSIVEAKVPKCRRG